MTRRGYLLVLLIIGLVSAGFWLQPKPSRAVDCQIKDLAWQTNSMVVGQAVAMLAHSTGCQSSKIAFKIYETDVAPLSNDFITKVDATINGNASSNIITSRYTFTTNDYAQGGNEYGNETMIFKPVIDGQEIDQKSAELILNKPTGGSGTCQLSSAKWNTKVKVHPIVGTPMQLIVKGAGCAKEPVDFKIFEYNAVLTNNSISQVAGRFDEAGNQAMVEWTINASGAGDNYGSYEFFFTVAVGSAKVQSSKVQVPVNSETGCVNCTNGSIPPDTVECVDGTKIPRQTAQSPQDMCLDHMADALGVDASGNVITWKGPNSIALGQPDLSFKITDPHPEWGSIQDVIITVINFIIQLGMVLSILFVVYNGLQLMLSAGEPAKYKKAIDGIKYSALGLGALLIAKGFVSLVISILQEIAKK